MTFAIAVRGGTHAGWKVQKTRERWSCMCPDEFIPMSRSGVDFDTITFRWHSGVTYSCPDCGARRPDAA